MPNLTNGASVRSFPVVHLSPLRTSALAAVLLFSLSIGTRVQAFGGFWPPDSGERVQQTSAKVIFVDNPDSTITALVQLGYAGPANNFAWVIPVPGAPEVGVTSNVVFKRLEAATAPQYWLERTVVDECIDEPSTEMTPDFDPGAFDIGAAMAVMMIDQGSVGAFDYVTLSVDSGADDPGKAATEWLATNGYVTSDSDADVLGAYLRQGLNLLAFKLKKQTDTGSIRPVTLTYESEHPVLPIRLSATAAQEEFDIQVWVIGPSLAIADNYPTLILNDSRIDWLTVHPFTGNTLPSGGGGPFGEQVELPGNYGGLVSAAVREAGGRGFVTELGGPASQYRDKVWAPLDDETFTTMREQKYASGLDALIAAQAQYGGWDGWLEAIDGAVTPPAGVTLAQFSSDPEAHRSVAAVDTEKLFQGIEQKVIQPVSDAAQLFHNGPYLTRFYSRMQPSDMTVDPSFDYNSDLAQVSNVHIARQSLQCEASVSRADAPWRIVLPQGGIVVGEGGVDWPVAQDSVPANLKVVELSTRGSGDVVTDNSRHIGDVLFEAAGTDGIDDTKLEAAQNGATIGGAQTVRRRSPLPSPREDMPKAPKSTDEGCSVSQVGAGPSASHAGWWLLASVVAFARRRRKLAWLWLCAFALGFASACSDDGGAAAMGGAAGAASEPLIPGASAREKLKDPETCKGCHPIHYREWSSSMHAYASQDPVFLAMNKRGQRETNGELGDFCVKCHAPMAVIDKRTTDGLNLEELPEQKHGVSCYFCHNTIGLDGNHNGQLRVANDTTMRGPIQDPLQPGVHQAMYSEMFEYTSPQSSALCGSCHDIVMPNGVHLERTFEEYRFGLFSKSATGEPPAFDSCVGCHMPPRDGLAAVSPAGTVPRTLHEHLWPGVDVAITEFPNRDAMRSAVEDCQLGAASLSFFTLEVTPPNLFTFQLETNAGHNQPSGASQDRRMWIEFLAYDDNGDLLEDVSSGNIADDEIEEKDPEHPKHDEQLVMFRDRIFDEYGKPAHMFWDAAKSKAYPDGYVSNTLPVSTTTYIEGKHAVVKQYRATQPDGQLPARVTARVKMRPIGLDVLHDLVDSGDLDPKFVKEMPTFTFGAQIEWTRDMGVLKPFLATQKSDCTTYRCLLDPDSPDCR